MSLFGFLNNASDPGPDPGYRQRDPEVLTPDMVFTLMEAADERPENLSVELINRSLEAVRARGHFVRARHIRKELRWLAKQAAKDDIVWDRVP